MGESIDEITPGNYKAWYNRGISQSKRQNYEDAVKRYDRALEINADRFEIWMGEHGLCINLENMKNQVKTMTKF
ncbi:MAG: tetratricopeptide repeat protein [Nitrosopumilus sp.]|nr:MAG: tetratricopeptide repeat protein [Nitrosopumilus sp.]